MTWAPRKVVLDANVLIPFVLRDTLLRSAALGMIQVYWSNEILSEVTRNLVARGRMTMAQAVHLQTAIENAFPEATINDFHFLMPELRNHEKDRHVSAVALAAGAPIIVTLNLKDFRPLPNGLVAQSPDALLLSLLEGWSMSLITLLQDQAAALRHPPISLSQLLTGLSQTAPEFVSAIRILLAER